MSFKHDDLSENARDCSYPTLLWRRQTPTSSFSFSKMTKMVGLPFKDLIFYVSTVKASLPPSNKKSKTVWSQKGTEHQGAIKFRAICSHSSSFCSEPARSHPIHLIFIWFLQSTSVYLFLWALRLHHQPSLPGGSSSFLSTPSHWHPLLNTPARPFANSSCRWFSYP